MASYGFSNEVSAAIFKVLEQIKVHKENEYCIRLLEYCLLFAEHQYGERTCKSYHTRDQYRVENWSVEIAAYVHLADSISSYYLNLANKDDDYKNF